METDRIIQHYLSPVLKHAVHMLCLLVNHKFEYRLEILKQVSSTLIPLEWCRSPLIGIFTVCHWGFVARSALADSQ